MRVSTCLQRAQRQLRAVPSRHRDRFGSGGAGRLVPKKRPSMLRTMNGSLLGANLRRQSFFSKISLQSGQLSHRRPQCREHVAHLHAITQWGVVAIWQTFAV